MRVIHNGKLIDQKKASISVYNKACYFDFGIYDSLKVVSGKIFLPEFHVKRFFQSAKLMDLQHDFKQKEVIGWIKKVVRVNKLDNSLIRLLMYGAGQKNEEPQLFIFPVGLTFYPNKLYKQGVKAITYRGERLLPECKSMDLLLGFLALREAYKKDALESLLVNQKGEVLEGTRSNLFIVKNKILYTAPVNKVLVGAARQGVLAIAKKLHIKVREQAFILQELLKADEIFITSTSMNVLAVKQVDKKMIGKGRAGEMTLGLYDAFRKEFRDWREGRRSVFDRL